MFSFKQTVYSLQQDGWFEGDKHCPKNNLNFGKKPNLSRPEQVPRYLYNFWARFAVPVCKQIPDIFRCICSCRDRLGFYTEIQIIFWRVGESGPGRPYLNVMGLALHIVVSRPGHLEAGFLVQCMHRTNITISVDFSKPKSRHCIVNNFV